MTERTCRTCTRPWDPDEEPSGDPSMCPDCFADAQREFADWLAGGWEA